MFLNNLKSSLGFRVSAFFALTAFLANSLLFPAIIQAQPAPSALQGAVSSPLNLPIPGTMVGLSSTFDPPIIHGLTFHPDNPFEFDFIVDTGDDLLQGEALRIESEKLIKYFMASLTVPEDEMWVNLSPHEQDRMIPEAFGQTDMGRDLLAQDYLLKQLSASLLYPEGEVGENYWREIFRKGDSALSSEKDINMALSPFLNRIWIVPEKAVVYVHGKSVFVEEARLKVMLEEDFSVGSRHAVTVQEYAVPVQDHAVSAQNELTQSIFRETILPVIEREINEGKNFAKLRQIYHSMILATWYKQNLKESLLGKVYVDRNEIEGIDIEDKQSSRLIYDQYLEAFEKGVYDFIREDYDPVSQTLIPRKYFSGGFDYKNVVDENFESDAAMLTKILNRNNVLISAGINTDADSAQIVENDIDVTQSESPLLNTDAAEFAHTEMEADEIITQISVRHLLYKNKAKPYSFVERKLVRLPSFRPRLIYLMQRNDLNQSKLASILGLHQTTINGWLRQEGKGPNPEHLKMAANYFEVEPSILYTGKRINRALREAEPGMRFKIARVVSGYSVQLLSEELSVDVKTVTLWELTGKISERYLKKLSNLYGIEAARLITGKSLLDALARLSLMKRVKLLHNVTGLSAAKLSSLLGYDSSLVSKLERGEVNFSREMIERLSNFFDIDITAPTLELFLRQRDNGKLETTQKNVDAAQMDSQSPDEESLINKNKNRIVHPELLKIDLDDDGIAFDPRSIVSDDVVSTLQARFPDLTRKTIEYHLANPMRTFGEMFGFERPFSSPAVEFNDVYKVIIARLSELIRRKDAEDHQLTVYQIGLGKNAQFLESHQFLELLRTAFEQAGTSAEEQRGWKINIMAVDVNAETIDTFLKSFKVDLPWDMTVKAVLADTLNSKEMEALGADNKADIILHRHTTYANYNASISGFLAKPNEIMFEFVVRRLLNTFYSTKHVMSGLARKGTIYIIEPAVQNDKGLYFRLPGANVIKISDVSDQFSPDDPSLSNVGTGIYEIRDPQALNLYGIDSIIDGWSEPDTESNRAMLSESKQIIQLIQDIREVGDGVDLTQLIELTRNNDFKRSKQELKNLQERYLKEMIEANEKYIQLFKIILDAPSERQQLIIDEVYGELRSLSDWAGKLWSLVGLHAIGYLGVLKIIIDPKLTNENVLPEIRKELSSYRMITGKLHPEGMAFATMKDSERAQVVIRSIEHDPWNDITGDLFYLGQNLKNLTDELTISEDLEKYIHALDYRLALLTVWRKTKVYADSELFSFRVLLEEYRRVLEEEMSPLMNTDAFKSSQDAQNSIQRYDRVMEIILNCISIYDGDISRRKELFSLVEVVGDAYRMVFTEKYLAYHERMGIPIEIDYDDLRRKNLQFYGDRVKIRNIFRTILNNSRQMWEERKAKKYLADAGEPQGLQITFKVNHDEEQPSMVTIEISDDAGGINDEHLLEPFAGDSGRQKMFLLNTSDREGGTGLGLAQVWYLAKLHDTETARAEVRFENIFDDVGNIEGAKFILKLPNASPETEPVDNQSTDAAMMGEAEKRSEYTRIMRLNLLAVEGMLDKDGKIASIEQLEQLTDSFYRSRTGKDGILKILTAYRNRAVRYLKEKPEGVSDAVMIARDLDFITDEMLTEYFYMVRNKEEILRSEHGVLLHMALDSVEGMLDKDGKIAGIEQLEQLTKSFFHLRAGNDGIFKVYMVYQKATVRYREEKPEGVSDPVMIARDLEFITDELWTEYLYMIGNKEEILKSEYGVLMHQALKSIEGMLNQDGKITGIEQFGQLTESFYHSRAGKDGIFKVYTAYHLGTIQYREEKPKVVSNAVMIARDLEFISDEIWTEYLYMISNKEEILKSEFGVLLHMAQSSVDGMLNQDGKITGIEQLEQLTDSFYRSRAGKDGINKILDFYQSGNIRYREEKPEGVSVAVMIARDLEFISDEIWEDYKRKKAGLQFDKDKFKVMPEYEEKYLDENIKEIPRIGYEDLQVLLRSMFDGNKWAYDFLLRYWIIISTPLLESFARKHEDQGVNLDFLTEFIQKRLDQFLRFQVNNMKSKEITGGLFFQRIKWDLIDAIRIKTGYRRRNALPTVLVSREREGNDGKSYVLRSLKEMGMENRNELSEEEIVTVVVNLLDTYFSNYSKNNKRNKEILLRRFGVDALRVKLLDKKETAKKIAEDYSIGSVQISQIEGKFYTWLLKMKYLKGNDLEDRIIRILARKKLAKIEKQGTSGADASAMSEVEKKRLAFSSNDVGGIDLNPAGLELQTEGDNAQFNWPEFQGGSINLPVGKFTPVIYQITPLTPANMILLLGLSDQEDAEQLSSLN